MNCDTFYSIDVYQTAVNVLMSAKLGMNRQQWIAAQETELFGLTIGQS